MSADFSKESLQARRDWQEIFKVVTRSDLQPRWLYPTKVSFRIERQIKSFPDNPPKKTKGALSALPPKLKEFIITKPLHEMLKGLI